MDNSMLLTFVPIIVIVISAIIEKATNCPIKFTDGLLVVFLLVIFFYFKNTDLVPSFVCSFILYAVISIIFSTYRKVRYKSPEVADKVVDTIEKVKDELSK